MSGERAVVRARQASAWVASADGTDLGGRELVGRALLRGHLGRQAPDEGLRARLARPHGLAQLLLDLLDLLHRVHVLSSIKRGGVCCRFMNGFLGSRVRARRIYHPSSDRPTPPIST